MKLGPVSFSFGRADRNLLSRWFWTIDRPLLALLLVLIGCGLIAVAAASPVASARLSGGSLRIPPLFFLQRQLLWALLGLPLILGMSLLTKEAARRVAIGGFLLFLAVLAMVPFIGVETNGAHRWIQLPGLPLNDTEWKYGGAPLEIMKIVTDGSPDVTKGMVAWKAQLSPSEIAQVVAYILSQQPRT